MQAWRPRGIGLLAVLLAALWTSGHADDPLSSSDSMQGAWRLSAADKKLDLSDPRVRERLRAAGINPADLEMLLEGRQEAVPGPGGPTEVDASQSALFPPVTLPPAMAPTNMDSVQAPVAPDEEERGANHFGYNIFTMSPKTFEPLAFGPVSPDYLIGPGDEIIITVWGAQELNAKVTVNREGYILLPDLGQVLVNSFTLGGLKNHVEKRLARIYSGIRSDGQGRTFVDVSLGKLRSIQVFVLGDVVQPGGYTMSATSTVMNALYYAGGPTLQGSMRNVRVLRSNRLLRKIDLYDYVANGDRSQDARLENGDVVFVPPVGTRVTLEGEVRHPAIYELSEGEKLEDLLKLAGGLESTAYLPRVQIERVIPFEQRSPMLQEDRKIIDLSMSEEHPGRGVTLYDGDIVRIFRVGDILRNTVELTGTAVYKPGTYEHRRGMTVADLIETAGGLLGDAYLGWGHLVRTRADKTRELRSFNLDAALARDPVANLQLHELDEVQVFSVWDIRDKEYVSIEGLVRKPGRYELPEGMTITDLIVRAGGLKESAYRVHAEVARINPEAISDGKTAELIQVAMGDELGEASLAAEFELRKNDIVFIREIPNWSLQENVWITGEVKFPGKYSLTSKMERLSSLIERAGGLDPTAYLRGANFMRKKDDTGRMAIDFEEALKRRRRGYSKYDLVMAAGDSIHIPREPKIVKVTGQVGFPSSVLWEKGRSLDYYIEQAGGTLESADKGKIRVVMANGRVQRPGWFSSPEPDAGATIIVPTKPEQRDRQTLKNVAQIVSILSGAATTIYLISRTVD
ncbi:MAG: SLBB domain-containing protein [Candidatus Krumholzibacteriia bacterium]